MIQLTLNVTAAQMVAIAAIMSGDAPVAEPVPATTRRKAKDAEPEKAPATDVKAEDTAGNDVSDVPSQADVTAAAQGYAKANGRDALVELLGKYGAQNVSGVPEDKRAEFIAACA